MQLTTKITGITAAGKAAHVPSTTIEGRHVISTRGWIRIASVQDEAFQEGQTVPDPEIFARQLRNWNARPDLFTFAQKITDPVPRFSYPMIWDQFAVVPITTYDRWLRQQIKQDVKEGVRRARREGVITCTAKYDDRFVNGIKDIYDETPLRQGRPFWHYCKPLETVRRENGTYLERSEYIGAYLSDELIGFIKMVYIDNVAKTMQVISKAKYFRLRPTTALIAKAVEVCASKGVDYFIYGPYEYPGKPRHSLTEFKRRHGFERIRFPRYYVPLNRKGRLVLALGLNRNVKIYIPESILTIAARMRGAFYQRLVHRGQRRHRGRTDVE